MEDKTILVWDLPLRLFHWLLVTSISFAYVTGKLGFDWLNLHSHSGALTISLVSFRFAWGFYGSTYSRFSSFPISIANIKQFLTSKWTGNGHSPLGAVSIYSLLLVILTQAVFGLFSMNDEIEFHGPFYDLIQSSWSIRLTNWHRQSIDILLVLIVFHILAIAYYLFIKGKNLITPMINGKVKLTDNSIRPIAYGGGIHHLLFSILIAAIIFSIIESSTLHSYLFQIPVNTHLPTGNTIW